MTGTVSDIRKVSKEISVEASETTRLLEMAADKKVVMTDAGLCNTWALFWLASWYLFSGSI